MVVHILTARRNRSAGPAPLNASNFNAFNQADVLVIAWSVDALCRLMGGIMPGAYAS
jgi:hypothetical protein